MRYVGFIMSGLTSWLLWSVSCAAQENVDAWKAEWFACQGDNQCALVAICGDGAINKNYVAYAEAFNSQCQQTSARVPGAIAQCVNGKCVVTVPRKTAIPSN